MITDRQTGKSRGYGFVSAFRLFSSPEVSLKSFIVLVVPQMRSPYASGTSTAPVKSLGIVSNANFATFGRLFLAVGLRGHSDDAQRAQSKWPQVLATISLRSGEWLWKNERWSSADRIFVNPFKKMPLQQALLLKVSHRKRIKLH